MYIVKKLRSVGQVHLFYLFKFCTVRELSFPLFFLRVSKWGSQVSGGMLGEVKTHTSHASAFLSH